MNKELEDQNNGASNRNKTAFQRRKNCQKSRDGLKEERKRIAEKEIDELKSQIRDKRLSSRIVVENRI